MQLHVKYPENSSEEHQKLWINTILKERKRPYAPYIPLEKSHIKVKGVEYPLQFEILGDSPLSFELVFLIKDGEERVDLYRIWFLDGELEAASYLPPKLSRLWEAHKLQHKLPFTYSEFYPLDKDAWVAVNYLGSFLIDGNANIVQQMPHYEETYVNT